MSFTPINPLPPSPSGEILHGEVRERINETLGAANTLRQNIGLSDTSIVKYDPASGELVPAQVGDEIGGSLAVTQDSSGVVFTATSGQIIPFSSLGFRTTVIADGVTCTVDFGDPSTYVPLDDIKSLEMYLKPLNGGQIILKLTAPYLWEDYNVSDIPVSEPHKTYFEMYNRTGQIGGLVSGIPQLQPTRRKAELKYTGLNITLTQNVPANLVNIIKNETPVYGQLAPFFNTTSDKLNVYNANASVDFKLTLDGSFAGGGSSNRAIVLDFVGTDNTIVTPRPEGITNDTMSFTTFISVDKDGNIATNGSAITLEPIEQDYTITDILLVAEQVTNTTEINIV